MPSENKPRTESWLMPPGDPIPPRIPAPAHRHASPSGPWPWRDLGYDDAEIKDSPAEVRGAFPCQHRNGECKGVTCWNMYPQSLFPNWTPSQVARSRIHELVKSSNLCSIYLLDIGEDGHFSRAGILSVATDEVEDHVKLMTIKRPQTTLLRVLFLESLSKPVVNVLGTKYNIEPFYFSSSLNCLPSRYQEAIQSGKGDHITLTLSFMKPRRLPKEVEKWSASVYGQKRGTSKQLSLVLGSDHMYNYTLKQELLAFHMIRDKESSTILSYHVPHSTASAKTIHERVALAGESVYWQNIFQQSNDPTLVVLAMLWYALYAWDESMSLLWDHISRLETNVLATQDTSFTQGLHTMRAHLLFFIPLLEDFRSSIQFIQSTPNPVMDTWNEEDKKKSQDMLNKECDKLLKEVDYLTLSRQMQDERLKNVMDWAFSSANAQDSRHMARLSEASLKDSAVMKQISYLTMIFFPASFAASIFGMNVTEIDQDRTRVWQYVATALLLTAATVWILIALHGKWHVGEDEEEPSFFRRLAWPLQGVYPWIGNAWEKQQRWRRNWSRTNTQESVESELRGLNV